MSQREQITGSAWVLEPGLKHPAEIAGVASVSQLYSVLIVFQNNSFCYPDVRDPGSPIGCGSLRAINPPSRVSSLPSVSIGQ